jgi:phosphate transport system substrate-binding protein
MRVGIYQLICILVLALPTVVNSKSLSLASKTGSLEINGTLLDFDGRYYSIESEYGNVVLDSKLFDCLGEGCQGNFSKTEVLEITSLPSLNAILLPALIENFARLAAGTLDKIVDGAQTQFVIRRGERELQIQLQTLSHDPLAQNQPMPADIVLLTSNSTETGTNSLLRNSNHSIWSAPTSRIIALDAYVPIVSPTPHHDTLKLSDMNKLRDFALHAPSDFDILNLGSMDRLVFHQDPQHLLKVVDEISNTVGILPISQIENTQILGLEAPCGTLPPVSHRTIKSRDYVWSVPVYMHVTNLQLGPQGQEFIEYLSSVLAQRVIQRAGFIDLTPEIIPLSAQGQRLALSVQTGNAEQLLELQKLMKTLAGSNRLTTTLFLQDDLRTLDLRSNSELMHLYRFLGSRRHNFKDVLVVGLSGSSESDLLGETLDKFSEEIGKNLINTSGGIKSIQTHLFNRSFPSTCDLSIANVPRIEIWAR